MAATAYQRSFTVDKNMEEITIKLTEQEVNFIVALINQAAISPGAPEALSIVVASQSILSKVVQARKKE